jgi:SH3 domain-containing YSC84-like protein 1
MRNLLKSHKVVRTANVALAFAFIAAFIHPAVAEDTQKRIQKAVEVLDKLTDSSGRRGDRPEEFGKADCVAVVPAFKKGAAVVGVSFGRGFISCRNGETWSAPAAVTLEGGSLGVQIGGEVIDIVILSLDPERRSKLFPIASQSARMLRLHGEMERLRTTIPMPKILFYGHTKGAFAGFDLDGTSLKPDDSPSAHNRVSLTLVNGSVRQSSPA